MSALQQPDPVEGRLHDSSFGRPLLTLACSTVMASSKRSAWSSLYSLGRSSRLRCTDAARQTLSRYTGSHRWASLMVYVCRLFAQRIHDSMRAELHVVAFCV